MCFVAEPDDGCVIDPETDDGHVLGPGTWQRLLCCRPRNPTTAVLLAPVSDDGYVVDPGIPRRAVFAVFCSPEPDDGYVEVDLLQILCKPCCFSYLLYVFNLYLRFRLVRNVCVTYKFFCFLKGFGARNLTTAVS